MKIKLSDSQQKLVNVIIKEKLQVCLSPLNKFFHLEKMENCRFFSGFTFSDKTARSLIEICVLEEYTVQKFYFTRYRLSETFLKNQQHESEI